MSNPKTKVMDLTAIQPHPDNPRYIRDKNFAALKKSVADFPEMLNARPIVVNKEMQVLGGNMRLEALRQLGEKTAPVMIVDWDEQTQKEFMIKDNVQQGEFDWDTLGNVWDQQLLLDWGIDGFHFGMSETDVLLPIDDDEYHEPKETDQPKLTDGYVKIEFVVKEDQKKLIMSKVRKYADEKDLQLGAALFSMLS